MTDLTIDEQREAALLAMNAARNPVAVEKMAAELVALRGIEKGIRRNRYLMANATVRGLLDRLTRARGKR